MEIITDILTMQHRADGLRREEKRIGVVPTMGFLHDGHLSLIKIARERCDVVIVTLFVNPTQFAPHEDFAAYPRYIERDTALCRDAGCDILFSPETGEMYSHGHETYVIVEHSTQSMEGVSRPDHFRGVSTVVTKLFNITKPHVAVFGQKDAQQAFVIKRMVRDLNFDIEIIIGPTVREADGLAMSSRNSYLTPDQRRDAAAISHALFEARRAVEMGERTTDAVLRVMQSALSRVPSLSLDYISFVDAETLKQAQHFEKGTTILIAIAARIGSTRLIDNILIEI